MFSPVASVIAAPPTTGLVVSAVRPPDDGGRWQDGLSWIPERCVQNADGSPSGYQLVLWCDTDDPATYEIPRPGAAYYRPIGVRWAQECTTLGGALDTERLRRIAEATTPYVIARELWDGERGQDDSYTIRGETYSNAYLASSAADTVGASATSLLPALARLEAAAAEATRGQRVMIHLPVLLSANLGEYARRVGQDWLTRADNIIVVDAGYPGTGPAGQAVGATAWAYATPPVQVRMTPLVLVEDPTRTVNRATNTVTAWAERVFAATFDPCAHFATEITV